MADRRNRVRFRGRSPSPRRPPPRPRDFSPSRRRKYSPHDRRKYSPHDRRGRDEYPRRIEKRDHLSRYEYNNRDRRYRSPERIRNPRRIERRDEFDRDFNNNNTSRNVMLPDYKDPSKGKCKEGVGVTRPYDEGLYRDGSSLKNFQWDHHFSDRPRKPDHFGGPTRDYNGVGCLGSGGDGLSSVSQYSDRTKTVSVKYEKYEREENTSSHSFAFRRGGINDMSLGHNISGADGISHVSSVVSRYLKSDTEKLGLHDLEKKKDDFGYQDDGFLGIGKRNEDNLVSSRGYFPSSQPMGYDSAFSGFNSVTRDHIMSQRGSGLDFQPPVFDGIKENTGDQLYMGLHDEKKDVALFGGMRTRLNDIEEDYNRHLSRNDLFNPAVDEGIRKEPTWGDERWGPYSFSQAQPTPDKFDTLGIGSSRLNYGYGSVKNEDDLQSRGYDPSLGKFYDVPPRKMSDLVEFGLDEPFDRRLGNKHARDDILYERNGGIRISADGNGARTIYNRPSLGNEIDFPNFSKRTKSNNEEMWRGLGDRANNRPTSSRFDQSRPDSRDIMKRLGPAPCKLHVSQRLVKKYKPSVMERLAPAPSEKHAALPWIKNMCSNEPASFQDSDRSAACDRVDQISLAKPEPPEKSEDFKQLVQSAFFKFLKIINETPAKRKKYTEQGEDGSLKCFVCGSNSDEFVDTKSLARHAFTPQKVGLRSQHLGLHRALCALMGWKMTEQLSSEWRCEVISDAEASALKEDLIIWPPVVIVYNSTINYKNHDDEQVIVSTEKLDMKLREMGFGSIVKVCNGKPGNQSVMLVKFNGTLSGLGEAERYHNMYAESNHGRADLKLLKSDLKGKMSTVSGEREEEFLYGHLGIAEDLDNLDFDTMKRCVLRSKNEILSIVNAL